MTLGEAIQSVQSLYSRGVQTQDSRLRPRHIYNQLIRARSTLLSQKKDKNQEISQWAYITLPCVELVQSDSNECPGVLQEGCKLLRSKEQLPRLIAGMDGNVLQSVSSIDGELIIDPIVFENKKYAKGNKYTSKKPRYFIYNQYLWITVIKRLQVIQITAPFDDPVEAWLYPSMCEVPHCIDIFEMDFPMSNAMMRTAVDMAVNELLSIFTQMQQDKNNDASDTSSTAGSMLHSQPEQ